MPQRPKKRIGDHSAKTGGTIRSNRKSKIKAPTSNIPTPSPIIPNTKPQWDPTIWSPQSAEPTEVELENAYFIAELENFNLSITDASDIIMEAYGLEDGEMMPVVINCQNLNIDNKLNLYGGKNNSVRLKKLTNVLLEYVE